MALGKTKGTDIKLLAAQRCSVVQGGDRNGRGCLSVTRLEEPPGVMREKCSAVVYTPIFDIKRGNKLNIM